jgi:hypothetical protein
LFSSFDSPPSVAVSVVRRVWLIVVASAGALIVGLVCLYTSIGRTAGFWLAVSIAVIATLAAYPETTVILVQAIFIGGAFTLASIVTKWLLADARRSGASLAAPASSVASLTATQPWLADKHDDSAMAAASGSTRRVREGTP